MPELPAPRPALDARTKLFVPFSEPLLAAAGPLGELVPFQIGYRCVRLLDGTFEFLNTAADTADH